MIKLLKLFILSLFVTGFIFACKPTETVKEQPETPSYEGNQKEKTPSYGEEQKEEVVAGDNVKGKVLFNDPTLGNGTAGISCNSCHPDGKGLERSGEMKQFNIMGNIQNSLEEAVNFCIVASLRGKAIDPKGKEMTDIVAYIKSLKGM